MFKSKILSLTLLLLSAIPKVRAIIDVNPTDDFESIAFDESIFRAYSASSMFQKQSRVKLVSKAKKPKETGVEVTSGVRNVRVLRSPETKKETKHSSLEKLVSVMVAGGFPEDVRKLATLRCSNSIIRSYLQIDEEFPSYNHPKLADSEMNSVCENNKTTCCNRQETFEIKKIFKEKQIIVRTLLKKFKKIVDRLGTIPFNHQLPFRENTWPR